MDREQILAIIERIGGDNPPDLAELETARSELAKAIHAEAKADQPKLDVLTTLRKAFGDVGTAITEKQAELAAQQASIEELLADVPDPDAPPAASDTPDPDEPPVEPEVPEVPEVPEAIVPDEVIEPIAAAATPPRTIPLRDAITRVVHRPATPAPPVTVGTPGNKIFLEGAQIDHVPAIREIAGAFERITRSPSTGKATLLRFDAEMAPEQMLPGTTEGNTALLEQFMGPEAIAAAGGCCSLPTPIRSQNVLSSSARPLQASLPTIGVTDTGAVTYFPAVCLPDEGAALWLCADDEDVDFDDDATWKECVFIDCPTAQTTIVDAVYRCLTIGEFQRRFATEQWMAIIQATIALQARIAEARLWARMLATVNTTHTVAATGSFFVTWAQGTLLAAESIREDQRYIDVPLRQWVPHWFRAAVASDLIARRVVDVDNPGVIQTHINAVLTEANVNQTVLGPDTQFIEQVAQANGTLQDYPNEMATVMAAEGHYSYLDGGQFDLGIEIRDLDLARQNAVAAFAEGFEGLLARGCNAKRMNFVVDVCRDAAGCEGTS